MADIRDVESLRNYLFKKADDDNTNNPYKIAKIHAYRDAFERLLALPIIATEPKHGRWIDGKCSVCNYGVESWNVGTNFCPNCGAKMDEKTLTEVVLEIADSVMMGD